jgi:signal transduction histidine kinase/CheY-like chemotaxis protein
MATLLVVDDHPANRELLIALLGETGHRVLEAADGAEALESVRAHRPDLVIADVLMPTMDGYELVRQIRSDPRISATPVIFYTAAYHESEVRGLAQSCGVHDVITKPSEPGTILSIVNSALEASPKAPGPVPVEDFDREHLRVVTNKLSQKADELETAVLRLRALVESGRRLTAERDFPPLLERLAAAAREIIGARHALAMTLSGGSRNIQVVRTAGFDQDYQVSLDDLPLNKGVVGRLLAWDSPLRIRQLGPDPIAQKLPAPHNEARSFLGAAICSSNTTYGVLCLSEKLGAPEFSEEDGRIAEALAAQTAVVCENIRQDEELRQYAQQLRTLAATLRHARQQERARVARELHENLGQNLAALESDLVEHARALSFEASSEDLLCKTLRMTDLVGRAMEAARKISGDLRPAVLDEGLVAAIEWEASEFQMRAGIRCILDMPESIALDREESSEIFWIIEEILNNIERHSGADTVRISIQEESDHYLIEAQDDGIGILPQEIASPKSIGLLGMRERAHSIGAALEILGDVGRGTRVRLKVPAAARQAAKR